jgi:hypothetical protein
LQQARDNLVGGFHSAPLGVLTLDGDEDGDTDASKLADR